jgi:glycine/D-amino acid oxidase-like deaminating enzyme
LPANPTGTIIGRMRVVVVGAGIVGASVAYHLARLGAAVTLIDRSPAPASGVTAASFAWIGDAGGDWPGGAADLRPYVRADHIRLAAEVPGIPLAWAGSLRWPADGPDVVGRTEIAELEPLLRVPPQQALWTPTDGAVDPVAMTRALVAEAGRRGARVVRAAVTGWTATGDVETSAGRYEADAVVLAGGTGTAALGVPVGRSPAVLIRATAPPGLVRRIVVTPEFEVRELRPGHLLMTSPLSPGRAAEAVGTAFGADVRLRGWAVGVRPMPPDGPLIGPLTPDGRLHVAVMHSAVTLAPTAGRLLAEELTSGRPAPALANSRPAGTARSGTGRSG